jgi:phosphoglucosamine mutase
MRFGTDGVRGVANLELTAGFALDLGRAAGRVLGAGTAVIGGDSRRSTPMLDAAIVAGLTAEGVDVIRLGVVPTPAVAFHASRLGAMGVMVSASHNPHGDNGIKLFAVGGTKLPDRIERDIESRLEALDPRAPGSGEPGRVTDASSGPEHDVYVGDYVDHLLAILDGRSLSGLHVVIDAANGAASGIARSVMERSGATTVAIHDAPDGRNINERCGATDVTALAAEVRYAGAHLGLALDGDADRLIAVDERGAVIDGDHVIAICATDLRDRGLLRDDTVVTTVMANLGFRRAMEAAGLRVVETPVGDRYVLEALDAGGYSLGGEQSGHVIFHDVATTGDGLLTGLVLADIVARAGRPLSELADAAMTRLPQVLVNVVVAERVPDVAEQLAPEIAAAAAPLGDDGRILVRPSGTEPLVRVMVEAATAELAAEVAHQLATVVSDRWPA